MMSDGKFKGAQYANPPGFLCELFELLILHLHAPIIYDLLPYIGITVIKSSNPPQIQT